ncbi:JEN1 [Candida metapsilosis]|uniref:JEN1 n=1 Tax=Candida metapsilosis TaxID=273372 RepID=A0A8H8DEG0_9ASCO|nr:JEN1 [Candida metapsilosis]
MKDTVEVEHISPYSSKSDEIVADSEHNDLFNEKPDLSWPSIKHYFSTRIPNMLDLPLYHTEKKWYQVVNPIPGLKEMTALDWNFYGLGFLAWSLDSMDFFCVSVSASEIAATLKVSVTDITWGVTLVLMLRSVGAIIFGIAADKFGRKWCYITICTLFIVVEIGTGFVQTYKQFLGVRAVFGILMGAMYPIAMVTAIEGQPTVARSVLSGLFLPGYSFGYILAMVFYRAFSGTYKEGEGWRSLFWFSAGLSVLLITWRFMIPESPDFIKLKEKKRRYNEKNRVKHKLIDTSVLQTLKTEWLLFIYLIFLYSGWNFTTHGSQDLYVTMLTKQWGTSLNMRTVIVVVSNLGGMIGGIIMGSVSELFGRRLTVIICMIWCGAFVYPSFFNANTNWWAYVFLNGGVMGAWGISSVYLLEVVNKANRALISGLAYQLGNLVSSASATIEARIGERFPLEGRTDDMYDYGKVMCIFCGAVFGYMIICVLVGPEKFHNNLHVTDDEEVKLEEGTSEDDVKSDRKM